MNGMHKLAHLLLILSALLPPATALAHAFPVRQVPGAGAVLTQAPAAVTIHFDSELEPRLSTLVVRDAQGAQVSADKGKVDAHDHTVLSARLTAVRKGTYHVYWHAETRDGHRTEGDYIFTVQ
jgi:methionine-rich copper-binding protein CopC